MDSHTTWWHRDLLSSGWWQSKPHCTLQKVQFCMISNHLNAQVTKYSDIQYFVVARVIPKSRWIIFMKTTPWRLSNSIAWTSFAYRTLHFLYFLFKLNVTAAIYTDAKCTMSQSHVPQTRFWVRIRLAKTGSVALTKLGFFLFQPHVFPEHETCTCLQTAFQKLPWTYGDHFIDLVCDEITFPK